MKTGILWSILENCRINDSKKHTDRLRCLEEFLSLGFWGKIGGSYQRLIVRILEDDNFNKRITKEIKKIGSKKGRPEKFYFTIFHKN